MFDAEATYHMDELQRQTADSLPYAAGHWQGDEAHDGDADGDHYQTFEVDEDHDTSLTPEKKQFKSNDVDSPDVIPLTQFVTKPPPHKTNVDDKDDENAFENVWDVSWIRDATLDEGQKSTLYPGGGLYSIAEEWERQRQLDTPVDNANSLWCHLYCDLCSRSGTTSNQNSKQSV